MLSMTPILVLTLLLSLPQEMLAYVTHAAEEFMPKKWSPFIVGTIILMIAFIASAFIMGWGAQYFGWDIFRVRTTISIGFFLFCFLAAVIYYNVAKRTPGAAPLGK